MDGTRQVARRIVNAEESFMATVIERTGCTAHEAAKVLSVYRKAKVVKMDAVGGTLKVKHGVFWDADILRNAIQS
jgi:hypothetical protein